MKKVAKYIKLFQNRETISIIPSSETLVGVSAEGTETTPIKARGEGGKKGLHTPGMKRQHVKCNGSPFSNSISCTTKHETMRRHDVIHIVNRWRNKKL